MSQVPPNPREDQARQGALQEGPVRVRCLGGGWSGGRRDGVAGGALELTTTMAAGIAVGATVLGRTTASPPPAIVPSNAPSVGSGGVGAGTNGSGGGSGLRGGTRMEMGSGRQGKESPTPLARHLPVRNCRGPRQRSRSGSLMSTPCWDIRAPMLPVPAWC